MSRLIKHMNLVRHGKVNTLSLWSNPLSLYVCRVHGDIPVQFLLGDSIHFSS
jgi:hypothetical protein